MNTPHTPGRIRFREQGDANEYCLLSEDGMWWIVAVRQNGQMLTERERANMRRIVQCWNAHDELLAAVAWRPIEDFDFSKDEKCRLVWMLAEEDQLIGECYFGCGPFGHPLLCPEPRTKAWRYLSSNVPLGAHLKPTHFRARTPTPKEVSAILTRAAS